MKKIFFYIFLIFIFSSSQALAQGLGSNGSPSTATPGINSTGQQNDCYPITTQEQFNKCCDSRVPYDRQPYACQVYTMQQSNIGCQQYPDRCPVFGDPSFVPTGGTQNTGGMYGNNDNGGIISPNAGSPELARCNAIRFKSVLDILIWIKCIIVSAIIPLIFVLAFVLFLWGILVFMYTSDNAKKEESKKRIMWGLIALFVMVSVWGIIKILGTTLGIESTVPLLQTEYLDQNKASR